MKTSHYLFALCLGLLGFTIQAQRIDISTINPEINNNYDPQDLTSELDLASSRSTVSYHAKIFEVNTPLSKAEKEADGYYFKLSSADLALRVFLLIDGFFEGDTLFILNKNGQRIESVYAENLYQNKWSSNLYSNELTLFYKNTSGLAPKIDVLRYSLEIPKSESSTEDFGDSDACEVNVNCSEGDPYQDVKKSVARILVKNGGLLNWCTGTLMNNTAYDCKMLFMTAEHCALDGNTISSTADINDWVFYFNFETPDCADVASENDLDFVRITGATLLARSDDNGGDDGSDFLLLELNSSLPSTFVPYYAGWSRVDNAPSNGVAIHQPAGDVKKISTFTQTPVSSAYGVTVNDTHWEANWAATDNGHGVTEGGSSGCPLLNSDGYITGTLTGGAAQCNAPLFSDFFGKFSYGWASNGSASNRKLSPWLDPINMGVMVLPGRYCDDSIPPVSPAVPNIYPTLLTEGQPLKIVGGNGTILIEVQIFDAQGRLKYNTGEFSPILSSPLEINIPSLPAGMYFVRIVGSGVNEVTKILRTNTF